MPNNINCHLAKSLAFRVARFSPFSFYVLGGKAIVF